MPKEREFYGRVGGEETLISRGTLWLVDSWAGQEDSLIVKVFKSLISSLCSLSPLSSTRWAECAAYTGAYLHVLETIDSTRRNGRTRLAFSFSKRVPGRRVPTVGVVRVSSTAPVDETYLRPTLSGMPYPMKRTPVDPSVEPDQPWTRLPRQFAFPNVNRSRSKWL